MRRAASGMPVYYHHWSFGKHFLGIENNYSRGQMGLAYEIVINSNPCIAYLMEENTLTMQALVIAHACYGHNSFFKGNYLFRTWTDADSIIDYMLFARNYIAECEEKHGVAAVENVLDACHALMNYGVDRYKRPSPISAEEEMRRQTERAEYLQQQVNDLWRTIPSGRGEKKNHKKKPFLAEPQENLLYFLEKRSPLLEPWQREVIRIVSPCKSSGAVGSVKQAYSWRRASIGFSLAAFMAGRMPKTTPTIAEKPPTSPKTSRRNAIAAPLTLRTSATPVGRPR